MKIAMKTLKNFLENVNNKEEITQTKIITFFVFMPEKQLAFSLFPIKQIDFPNVVLSRAIHNTIDNKIKIINGIGTPNNIPLFIIKTLSEKLEIADPFDSKIFKPLSSVIVPSVARIGETLIIAINTPFTRPIMIAVIKPNKIAMKRDDGLLIK